MTKQEQRRQEWVVRIADYEASGQTMKAWCETKNVTKDQVKYWIRALKARPTDTAQAPPARFLPLTLGESSGMPSASSLFLHVSGIQVEVRSGFNPNLLREVVAALSASC